MNIIVWTKEVCTLKCVFLADLLMTVKEKQLVSICTWAAELDWSGVLLHGGEQWSLNCFWLIQ
jgi:hypothetical protein